MLAHRLVIERDRTATAAVEAEEWELRRVEIERQAEQARREKKRRRAESELALRSQVPLQLFSLPLCIPSSRFCVPSILPLRRHLTGALYSHSADQNCRNCYVVWTFMCARRHAWRTIGGCWRLRSARLTSGRGCAWRCGRRWSCASGLPDQRRAGSARCTSPWSMTRSPTCPTSAKPCAAPSSSTTPTATR